MRAESDKTAALFLADAHRYFERNLAYIVQCLRLLTEDEIWWRPNPASNSAGNLALHLCGNIRQWIISGLGGAPDTRARDKEFSERGPISRRALIARLQATVRQACGVLVDLSPEALARKYAIQGFRVTGFSAVSHVYEHFSYHAGQVVYLTKLKRGQDLRFTRLPGVSKKK